jgi:hypothetical protein
VVLGGAIERETVRTSSMSQDDLSLLTLYVVVYCGDCGKIGVASEVAKGGSVV